MHTSDTTSRDDNLVSTENPEPVDFDNLVNDILDNPELILNADLSESQILEIQKRLNPYAGIAGPPPTAERKRIAAVSYTNLREDYLRRFTATSLVGFLFQTLSEWEVPVDKRQWVSPEQKSNPPFEANKLIERLEATLAIAKEAASANEEAIAAKQIATELDVTTSDTQDTVAEKYAEFELLSAKSAGLLYAATHATYSIGTDASSRLKATAEAGMKYPDVKSIITRFPLPPAPGTVEIPASNAKEIINSFLRNWFEFDPSIHVRSGHNAKSVATSISQILINNSPVSIDTKDPGHLTIEAVKAMAPTPSEEHKKAYATIVASKRSYDAVAALLRDAALAEAAQIAIENGDTFCKYLFPVSKQSPARTAIEIIPPQDTFHRWAYYSEVNYEELRTITEAIYPERPDLDWAIAIWDVFEGTEKEVNDAFDKHCQRYQDEVPSAIKALDFGNWSLLADFKENRKKIQFYNKNTEVLKRILDRHSDDKRIGAELMRNRVRQAKAKNIVEEGPDAPGLSQYKRNVSEKGQDLAIKGVEKVISTVEMKRLEKANGNIKAAQELEVLEQYEDIIKRMGEMEKLRPLTEDEIRDYEVAKEHIDMAREMIEVPDDAIQVDIFTNNSSTGEFGKSHFYTKAVAPDAQSDESKPQGRQGAYPFSKS